MSNYPPIVLRTVYALNSSTGLFLNPGQSLFTDAKGGTFWADTLTVISNAYPEIGYLPSTITQTSSITYSTAVTVTNINSTITYNTNQFTNYSSIVDSDLSSLQGQINNYVSGPLTQAQLTSTVAGLGSASYVSSLSLTSSLQGLGLIGYVSTSGVTSTTQGLGLIGYVSTSGLVSTVTGLGSASYVSTLSLRSTLVGLGSVGYLSTPQLTSTVAGLADIGYVSSTQLTSTLLAITISSAQFACTTSTTIGLGTISYVSSASLTSSLIGLSNAIGPTVGGITTNNLVSTTSNLISTFSNGIISTSSNLTSTLAGFSTEKTSIRFDTATSVQIIAGNNEVSFYNTGSVIYVSSFFMSSVFYSGNNSQQLTAQYISPYQMRFSTANINLSPFSTYINSTSRVILDVYPQIAFSKLATGATNVAQVAMSTFIQMGQTILSTPIVTTWVNAVTTKVILEGGPEVDGSNWYNTPLRLTMPLSTIPGNYLSTLALVHILPCSINNGQFQNCLHNCNVTPYFGSTNSVFVTVQNIPPS